jgi:hypothetical protein
MSSNSSPSWAIASTGMPNSRPWPVMVEATNNRTEDEKEAAADQQPSTLLMLC